MGRAVRVRDDLVIPAAEIVLHYVRASGPGGQNVNKVASKAVLRFNVRDSPSLAAADRERVLARLAPRLTNEGELVLASGVYRDQSRNRGASASATASQDAPLAGRCRAPPRRETRARRAQARAAIARVSGGGDARVRGQFRPRRDVSRQKFDAASSAYVER